MHEVLQRTRSTEALSSRSSGTVRSFPGFNLLGRRGLGLLTLLVVAAFGSQVLYGLLRPSSRSVPATPAGSDGRDDSTSSAEPVVRPAPVTSPSSSPAAPTAGARASSDAPSGSAAPRQVPASDGFPRVPASSEGVPAVPPRPYRQSAARVPVSSALRTSRGGGDAAPAAPSPRPQPATALERPLRSRQGNAVSAAVIAEPSPPAKSGSIRADGVAATPAPLAPAVPVRQSGGVPPARGNLAEADPFQGVPCSDTTAALPSDRLPEEAWLPLPEAFSVRNPAPLDDIPAQPISFALPDRADGPPSESLQANSNIPCLLKQPAGRN